MRVVCSYYTNCSRLGLVVDKLGAGNNIGVFPITGVIIRSKGATKCIGPNVELLVYSYTGGTPVLLTNNSEYCQCNGTEIEYDIVGRESIYVQALRLCAAKVATSKNAFSMECALRGCTAVASTDGSTNVSYAIHTPSGEILTESENVPLQLYTECQSIKSFRYSIVTDTCEKDIVVRKGQVEVFREIAHYINKALVFTRVSENQVLNELCVTATGCCEVKRLKDGSTRLAKVPFTKVKIDSTFAISAVDCSLDELLRSPNICAALSGGILV